MSEVLAVVREETDPGDQHPTAISMSRRSATHRPSRCGRLVEIGSVFAGEVRLEQALEVQLTSSLEGEKVTFAELVFLIIGRGGCVGCTAGSVRSHRDSLRFQLGDCVLDLVVHDSSPLASYSPQLGRRSLDGLDADIRSEGASADYGESEVRCVVDFVNGIVLRVMRDHAKMTRCAYGE
jgi:hypothetical protein